MKKSLLYKKIKKEDEQMSKRLIAVLVAILAVSFAIPAFAAVQNVKVSGDLLTRGISRTNFGLEKGRDNTSSIPTEQSNADKENRSYFDAIARIRVDADLTEGVGVTMRTITERKWGRAGEDLTQDNEATKLDLDLAYVTLKDVLNVIDKGIDTPVALTIGRQELRYGNAFIIGSPTPGYNFVNNTAATIKIDGDLSLKKSFDAIKAVVDLKPLVVDLVYSKINEGTVTRYTQDRNDTDLFGINANYTRIADTLLEGYWWLRLRDKGALTNSTRYYAKKERTYVLGGRGVYTGLKINESPLIIGAELAWQFGNMRADAALNPDISNVYGYDANKNYKRSALGLQTNVSYTFDKIKYTPGLTVAYTYLSGAKGQGVDGGLEPYGAWDPMFEDQGVGQIANAIFAQSNCHSWKLSGNMKPTADTVLSADWIITRLAKNFHEGQVVTASGLTGGDTFIMSGKKDFYQEIDANLAYNYTEDVQFNLGGGVLIPGGSFAENNGNGAAGNNIKYNPASQVIGSMKVTF
jgi:hypothetical protein